MKGHLKLIAMALTPAFAAAVQAQTPVATDKTLGAVVVTASRSDTKLENMPLHTTIISQEEISRSPAQTLDQVLRNVPGLLVPGSPYYTTDPTGHNIKFRGMDKKVLVLVDGMPVHDPFFTTIQWFKVPLGTVERVEVVRGGGSQWGNLAVGGVINIISKRPTASDGDARVSAGMLNTYNGSVTKNIVLSDMLSLSFSGDAFKTGGYNNTPESYRAAYFPGRGKSSADSQNFRASAYFKPGWGLDGFLRLGYHQQDEQIGGFQYGSNLQKSPDLASGLTKWFDDHNRVQANFWAQWVSFDKYNGAGCYASAVFVCGTPATAPGATAAQQASPILQYASSHDLMDYRERGGSIVYSRDMRGLLTNMQLGADFRRISGEDDQQSYRTPTAGALNQAFRIQRTNFGAGMQQFTGVFAQFKLSPLDPLEVSLSTRWDSYRSSQGVALQTNFTNVATPTATNIAGGGVPDLAKSSFNPSLSARYDVNDRLALRGNTYRAFRAPGLNNMYRTFGSGSITVANPSLGPETLTGREFGFDWKGNNYSFGATLFRTDVKDVVANFTINPTGALTTTNIPLAVQAICGASVGTGAPLCTGTVSYNTNGQDQRSNGLEVDGKWEVNRQLSLGAYATRTLTYYTSTTTGDPIDKQIQLVPKNVLGVNLVWRAGDKWTTTFDTRYNGAMTLNLTNSVTTPVSQGGYTVFSLGASYQATKATNLFAGIVNLSNKIYTDSSASSDPNRSYAMPRTLTAGVKVRF